MTAARALPALLALLVVLLAGCLGGSTTQSTAPAHDHHDDTVPQGTELVSTSGCRESGSVAVYAMGANTQLADGFERADIDADVGRPLIGAYETPLAPGPKTGNWHMALVCDHYTIGGADKGPFVQGWIAVKVKPPAWDTSGIQRQFFVADLSFNDPALVEEVAQRSNAHLARALSASIEWMTPGPKEALHFSFQDANHGNYEAWFAMKDAGKLDLPATRYWIAGRIGAHHEHAEMSAEPAADGYRATSIDLITTPNPDGRFYLHQDGVTMFRHDEPDGTPIVGHYGPSGGGILWDGFARTYSWGEAPADVVLKNIYAH